MTPSNGMVVKGVISYTGFPAAGTRNVLAFTVPNNQYALFQINVQANSGGPGCFLSGTTSIGSAATNQSANGVCNIGFTGSSTSAQNSGQLVLGPGQSLYVGQDNNGLSSLRVNITGVFIGNVV